MKLQSPLEVGIRHGHDLQREFHRARQNTALLHSIPQLPLPSINAPERVDLATIRQAIAAARHLFQLLQPQLEPKAKRKLRRLTQRLLNIGYELDSLSPKMIAHWPVNCRPSGVALSRSRPLSATWRLSPGARKRSWSRLGDIPIEYWS